MSGIVGKNAVSQCREPGCDRAPVDRANFCTVHLDKPRRCKATRRHPDKDGVKQRCKQYAMIGLEVCNKHGGSLPGNKAKSERTKALSAMQRFVKPYDGDIDPISAFELEFRRTLGRINWYDEQLAQLSDSNDLIWGLTKEERISASEYPGRNRTFEARVNMLEDLQRWERKHLLDLEKIWLQANLDERKLNLMKQYVELGYQKTLAALVALGVDVKNPAVRATVAAVFMEDQGAQNVLALPAYEIEQVR